jgi:hypothetical protein
LNVFRRVPPTHFGGFGKTSGDIDGRTKGAWTARNLVVREAAENEGRSPELLAR